MPAGHSFLMNRAGLNGQIVCVDTMFYSHTEKAFWREYFAGWTGEGLKQNEPVVPINGISGSIIILIFNLPMPVLNQQLNPLYLQVRRKCEQVLPEYRLPKAAHHSSGGVSMLPDLSNTF